MTTTKKSQPPQASLQLDTLERFRPFVRTDAYGQMGQSIPPLEYPRLAIASVILAPLRGLFMFLVIFSFYLVCLVYDLLPGEVGKMLVAPLGRLHSRAVLLVLGVLYLKVNMPPVDPKAPKAAGIVCNHVGWMDILVAMSLFFPSFVAKDGVAKINIVGRISKKMRCLFVQREQKSKDYKGVSGEVRARMEQRADDPSSVPPMLLFPEGTTTNGGYLLPFKTGAFLAGTPVQPMLLRYASAHVSPAWESISMPRHLFLTFCTPWIRIDVDVLPVYEPSDKEKADPKLYAANVRAKMLEHSRGWLTPSEATLQDKRLYHAILRGEQPLEAAEKED